MAASPGVIFPVLAASLLGLAVFPPPPATAQSFLEIADSVRDRNTVPRPSPNSVPEFILIAEMANQNRRTTVRPPAGLPDFLQIGESFHNAGNRHTTSAFEMPSREPPPTTPMPPEITGIPEVVDFNEFTRPSHEVTQIPPQETTPEMEMLPEKVPSSTEDSQMTTEEFEEDKIYFEEWDKKVGDPR